MGGFFNFRRIIFIGDLLAEIPETGLFYFPAFRFSSVPRGTAAASFHPVNMRWQSLPAGNGNCLICHFLIM